ncbi:hypothetical protein fHeYen902_140 [Yersinia phage fHe-Yen9-02]|nr:hypothetical protein fHeYen902_140 [Yersinia phage fHe-Yen9-02]
MHILISLSKDQTLAEKAEEAASRKATMLIQGPDDLENMQETESTKESAKKTEQEKKLEDQEKRLSGLGKPDPEKDPTHSGSDIQDEHDQRIQL